MKVELPGAPAIPGLRVRFFRDKSDYAVMAEIFRLAAATEGFDYTVDAEEMAFAHAPSARYDPHSQIVIVEVEERPVAFSSVRYAPEKDGSQVYRMVGLIVPEWQRRGLGRALLRHNETLARGLAAHYNAIQREMALPSILDVTTQEEQIGANALLAQEGYLPARYFCSMVRPELEGIAELPLPPGVEIRPAEPEQYRQIWEADVEAFADNWGETFPGVDAYERWLANPHFNPALWRVAWAGGQVVGQVRSFIVASENEEYGRLRGYTENISVRKEYRRQGLATALLCHSLRAVKEAGMREAALEVDTDNPAQALRIYERCGFRVEKRMVVFRKPIYTANV